MRLLLNGNIEITTQLTPDAYAALKAVAERDGISDVNVINLAVMTLNHVSEMAFDAGKPLGEAMSDKLAATDG